MPLPVLDPETPFSGVGYLTTSGTFRLYRLPGRCPRCGSRSIYAELDPHDGGVFIFETCPDCGFNRRIRAYLRCAS